MMQKTDVDPAFQSLIGMGQMQKIYKQRRSSMLPEIFHSAFSFAMVFLALYEIPIVYNRDGLTFETVLFVLFVPVMIFLGVYFLWRLVSWWNDSAVVYQNGFGYLHGKQVAGFRWDEIISIRLEVVNFRALGVIPFGQARDYRISSCSAQLRLASTLNQIDDLASEIRKGAFPYMLARSKQELDCGKNVPFGSIIINKNGVRWKNQSYPWTDLAKAGLAEGMVHYVPRKHGLFNGMHVMAREVTNFDVLLALSNDMIHRSHRIGGYPEQ